MVSKLKVGEIVDEGKKILSYFKSKQLVALLRVGLWKGLLIGLIKVQ